MNDVLFNAIPDPAFVTNTSGLILHANKATSELSGYALPELLQLSLSDLLPDAPTSDTLLNSDSLYESRLLRNDGSLLQMEIHCNRFQMDGQTCMIHICRPQEKRSHLSHHLKQSEEKFSRVFHASPDPLLITEFNTGRITDINEGFSRVFGYSMEESLGRTTLELGLWPHPELRLATLTPLRNHDYVFDQEVQLRAQNGNILTLLSSSTILTLDNIDYLVVHLRDITARKEMESALQNSETRYRQFAEQMPLGVVITQNGVLKYVNSATASITGYSREELQDSPFIQYIHTDDRNLVADIHVRRMRGETVESPYQARLVNKDGSHRACRIFTTTVDWNGQPSGLGVLADLTETLQIEQKLRETIQQLQSLEQRNRQLSELLPIGVVITQKGSIKYANQAIAQMLGYDHDYLMATPFLQFIHDDDRERIADYHWRRMRGEQIASPYFLRLNKQNGEVRECKIYATTVEWEDEVSSLTVVVDITDSLRIEEKLHFSIQQMQEKEQAKTRFLAAASHDLRQPLHAIGLFVSALQERAHSSETHAIIQRLDHSTEALRGLLNALLDISRLDAGVVRPKIAAFAIQPLFDRLQHEFSATAQEKNLHLRLQPSSRWIHSDPSLLERILRNLLSNAIRYTPHGRVVLGCRLRGNTLRIEVWDNGIGIATSEQERIFQEFYQIGNAERDRNQGLGLGLAIAQRLARLLNLQILLTSTPGKGSVFSLNVPLADNQDQHEAEPAITAIPYQHMQDALVVVIDDELSIQEATRLMLEDWGCTVIAADSCSSAMKKLQQDNLTPAAIIADYRLRGNTTGAEAIKTLHHAFNPAIPAIIITGDTDPERLREANESGYHLLHKPLAPAKLRTLLSHLLNRQ